MQPITQTTRYAIQALSYVGDRPGRWVLVRDIAHGTVIPKPYLAKILNALAGSGLIKSKRGYRGGVMLSKPAGHVTVLDVVQAVHELEAKPICLLGTAECSDDRACPVHDFWEDQRRQLESKLARITLSQVATFEKLNEISHGRREVKVEIVPE